MYNMQILKKNSLKILNYIFLFPIYFYKIVISPFFPSCCRFTPTCSEYTIQAIKKFGVVKGIIMGIIRISKCHPFSKYYGWDPLPNKFCLKRDNNFSLYKKD